MVYDLAGAGHWDQREGTVRPRLPSRLNPAIADIIALIAERVGPGSRVLEVGCAPGKFLLWCNLAGRAEACGVEYAERSYRRTVRLFAEADADADIRHEDFLVTSFDPGSFDFVYSIGVIEHFTDPRPMISKHVDMLNPGGTAIIAIPNFAGAYGWVLQKIDREIYDLHNVSIMNEEALLHLAPGSIEAKVYRYGRFSPWIVFGRPLSTFQALMCAGLSVLSHLQPFTVKSLCPWLVLEIKKPLAT